MHNSAATLPGARRRPCVRAAVMRARVTERRLVMRGADALDSAVARVAPVGNGAHNHRTQTQERERRS